MANGRHPLAVDMDLDPRFRKKTADALYFGRVRFVEVDSHSPMPLFAQ
jgi:hypothetical protein